MEQFEYVITDPLGLHARPAGQLVKVAASHDCKITLEVNGKSADARRIMATMQLAVKQGDTLTVICEGSEESTAAMEMKRFLKENL